MRTVQQQLVRSFCGDANDVSGAKLALDSANDFAVALFVRIGGLRALEGAAD